MEKFGKDWTKLRVVLDGSVKSDNTNLYIDEKLYIYSNLILHSFDVEKTFMGTLFLSS